MTGPLGDSAAPGGAATAMSRAAVQVAVDRIQRLAFMIILLPHRAGVGAAWASWLDSPTGCTACAGFRTSSRSLVAGSRYQWPWGGPDGRHRSRRPGASPH